LVDRAHLTGALAALERRRSEAKPPVPAAPGKAWDRENRLHRLADAPDQCIASSNLEMDQNRERWCSVFPKRWNRVDFAPTRGV